MCFVPTLGYSNLMVDRNIPQLLSLTVGYNSSLATFAFIALANHFDTKAELLFGSNPYIKVRSDAWVARTKLFVL